MLWPTLPEFYRNKESHAAVRFMPGSLLIARGAAKEWVYFKFSSNKTSVPNSQSEVGVMKIKQSWVTANPHIC